MRNRYLTATCDGEIRTQFETDPRSGAAVYVWFGNVRIDITVDEARGLRDALDRTIADSNRPLCSTCNGDRHLCGECDYTGLAPVEAGAR